MCAQRSLVLAGRRGSESKRASARRPRADGAQRRSLQARVGGRAPPQRAVGVRADPTSSRRALQRSHRASDRTVAASRRSRSPTRSSSRARRSPRGHSGLGHVPPESAVPAGQSPAPLGGRAGPSVAVRCDGTDGGRARGHGHGDLLGSRLKGHRRAETSTPSTFSELIPRRTDRSSTSSPCSARPSGSPSGIDLWERSRPSTLRRTRGSSRLTIPASRSHRAELHRLTIGRSWRSRPGPRLASSNRQTLGCDPGGHAA